MHQKWYDEAKQMTLEKLPAFLRKLSEHTHDYDSIIHSLAAGAVAAASALNHSPQGGITGFQAGGVMWEFMKHWNYIEGPAKIVQFKNLLSPHQKDYFEKTISPETWKYIQEEAQKEFDAQEDGGPGSNPHLESILAGKVPFGYKVKD